MLTSPASSTSPSARTGRRTRALRSLATAWLTLSLAFDPVTTALWAEGPRGASWEAGTRSAYSGGRTSLADLSLDDLLNAVDEEARSPLRLMAQDPGGLTTEDALLLLLADADSRTRGQALEIASRHRLSPGVLEQIQVLSIEDRSAIVQAKARLALADAGLDRTPTAAPVVSTNRPAVSQATSPPRGPAREKAWEPAPVRVSIDTDWLESDAPPRSRSIRQANAATPAGPGAFGLVAPLGQVPLDSPEMTPPPLDLDGFPAEYGPGEAPPIGGGGVAQLNDFGTARPDVLDRPLFPSDDIFPDPSFEEGDIGLFAHPVDAPLGYAGRSSVLPEDYQQDSHFVPLNDRWRSGFPAWDRYGKGHPPVDDYPYQEGSRWDPYNLNVLKGDYPAFGQHTFLKLTGQALILNEYRQLPTPTTPFESTVNPGQEEFFGDPNQYFTSNFFRLSVELFNGNTAFKPVDWALRLTPIFNFNYLDVNELGVVSPDVRRGTTRQDNFLALEEYFLEAKLADLSPDYDFLSARIGSQPFTSDFRGFIFSDINRGVRLFGTRFANRDQFNVVYFDQTEKDTNSQLNTFSDRNQQTIIANYYRQDFIFPGYTAQASIHHNIDGPSKRFDKNGFLARPDPAGNFTQHKVEATYFGITGEGHMGKINVSNSFYWVVGKDSLNPIAGTQQDISAQMAAVELSYDRDWIRFRGSFFYASGDEDTKDGDANGFDSIFDNPNFAGGQFSFWNRQQIQLFGVGLKQRLSLVPDLRSSKFQGQSNFINPGLLLFNLGMDFEITPKLRLITNANYLEFDDTNSLEHFTFQDDIDKTIGVDLSAGMEYRPFHNDNVIIEGGYAALVPGAGFDDLYGTTDPFTTANALNYKAKTLHSAFLQMVFTY